MSRTSEFTGDTVLVIGSRRTRLRVTVLIDGRDPHGLTRHITSAEILDETHPLCGMNVFPILMPKQQETLEIAALSKKSKKWKRKKR